VAHVLLSIVLGAVIIAVGLQFRDAVASAQDAIIGCLLIATGLGFAVLQATGHGHAHDHDHAHDHHGHGHDEHHHGDDDHHHGHGHDHQEHAHHHPQPEDLQRHGSDPGDRRGIRGVAAVMVPFGAAASPDLTILPVFLAATTAGVATAVGSVLIFGAATIGTIVGLTLGAARGGYQIKGEWLDRWGNAVTALVLVVIGALVLAGIV
jgi:hypothetical protein